MAGLFRPKRLGKVFSYANQYIETSFLLFLIPLKSYFINLNTKETIEIPLNNTSLRNYYVSLALVGSGILFFVVMIVFGPTYSENDNNAYLGYLPAIVSGLLVLCGLIYSFQTGKSSQYEIKKRTIFQSVVEINALPEWLNDETAKAIYEKNKVNLLPNWKDKIINGDLTSDDLFYYYTMLSYENRILPTNEIATLLNQLDQKIKK
jgi:hypothetical protein